MSWRLGAGWTSIRRHWPLLFVCNRHRLRTTSNSRDPFRLWEIDHQLRRRKNIDGLMNWSHLQKKRQGRVESKRILINSTSSSYSSKVTASVKPVFKSTSSAVGRMHRQKIIQGACMVEEEHHIWSKEDYLQRKQSIVGCRRSIALSFARYSYFWIFQMDGWLITFPWRVRANR